jgi:hypothetical protein
MLPRGRQGVDTCQIRKLPAKVEMGRFDCRISAELLPKRTRRIPREVIAYTGVSSCSIMDSRSMRQVREWRCLLGWRAVLEVCGDSGTC